jgi:putative hydrolase of the HAD superfamily
LIKISKKAVFFDFGDTLASTDPPYIIRIANGFRNAGYDISNKDFIYAYLKADYEIYKKHKTQGTISSEQYNSWFFPILCEFLNIDEKPDEIRLRMRKNNTPRRFSRAVLPGTFELLSYLKEQGYTLGVISNNDGFTDRKCKDLDIDKFFDIIADSTNLGYVKPDPRIFHHVLNELGLEPEDCLHVGDMYGADVLGAKNAGLDVVWLNYRGINILDDTETIQIKELAELIKIL